MKSAAFLALIAAALPAPIAAGPPTATVDLYPGDFGTTRARSNLNHRIRAAIEQVCGAYDSIEQYQWPEMDSCWRTARAQVNARLAASNPYTQTDKGDGQ